MGIFGMFSKKDKGAGKRDIFEIPCDYNGIDVTFKNGVTSPDYYVELTNIITNGKMPVDNITFTGDFYDGWVDSLLEKGFGVDVDSHLNIVDFVNGINGILKARGDERRLDETAISQRYNEELKTYTLNGKELPEGFIYDILEANVIADELRKIGYELICFFNGFDNNIKTFVKLDEVERVLELEAKNH